jgi:anti-sigma regulatory factor (Ser/Thr protein kinase)
VTTAADQIVALQLASDSRAPAEARALVDALAIRMSSRQRYDMRLALSELVTNSVIHGNRRPEDPVDIRIDVSGVSIRCEVGDRGPGFRRDAPHAAGPGGLGLLMVERIAARWGTREGGRRVWFELDRTG